MRKLTNPACRISLTGKLIRGQKGESRKRLSGFIIWLAGYGPENNKRDFGLPVSLTGWPDMDPRVRNTNSACRFS